MPRYHFNVRDGHDIDDVEGTDLPDFRAARREAIRLSGALLENEADQFDAGEIWEMEVTDDAGLILFLMTFSIMQSPAVPMPRIKGPARLG